MFRIAVVEDDPKSAQTILDFLKRYGTERKEALETVPFANGLKLMEDYHPVWDVILLDIEMPEMDGMTAARRIRKVDSEAEILFITNMSQYAAQGYEVDAIGFLLKPVTYFAFSTALDKALRYARNRQTGSLVLQQEDGLRRIAARDICYVEVSFHRLQIHTVDGVVTSPGSLGEIEQQLDGEPFTRCNKGYLVNLRHVQMIQGLTVRVGGDELLISRRKRKDFLKAVTDYYGGGGR